MALTDKLTAIANAIRAKTGGTAAMTLAEMPTEIASIQTGITPSGSITLTSENTYDVTEKATAVVDFSSTRANLAEAVTAKGVDTLPTSSFDTIATNIGLISGGGGLPSSISKIDGGSFTLAASKVPENHWINHNLGVVPKGFSIWTNSRPPTNGVNAVGFVNVYLSYDPGSGHQGYYAGNKLWQGQPTSESIVAGWITAPTQYADSTRFRWWASAASYEADVTYNWIAWA